MPGLSLFRAIREAALIRIVSEKGVVGGMYLLTVT
jgi:hypothetical protein